MRVPIGIIIVFCSSFVAVQGWTLQTVVQLRAEVATLTALFAQHVAQK